MNTLEQFIAVYEPEGDVSAGFRKMLEQVIQEVKRKAQPANEVIGMRDYFAIKIVQAMISNKKIYEMHPDEKSIVKDAYIVADYMMEARKA